MNNSLIVEEQIYRNIITNLLHNHHTPHLVKYIDSVDKCDFSINTFTSKLSDRDKLTFTSAINGLKVDYGDIYNFDQSVITILEQSEKTTLFNILTNNTLSSNNIFILIFQLLYTLLVFNSIGLTHNDFHFHNIFVNRLDEEIILNYRWEDKIFSIKTRYVIKIFDWDRGSIYHPAVQRNLEIDTKYCSEFGQCNGLTFVDYEAMLSGLIEYCKKQNVLDWVKSMTPKTFDVFKNREFLQLKKFEEPKIYPENDLVPLNKAFKSIIKILKEKKMIDKRERIDKKEIIYTIPLAKKFTFQSPVSINTHTALISRSSWPNINYKFDEKKLIIIQQEFEILDYDLKKTSDKLYLMVNGKKNIPSSLKNAYLVVSICLSIPFWYNLDDNIKKKLYNYYTGYEDNIFLEIESDIWNMFNNILPVKVIVL